MQSLDEGKTMPTPNTSPTVRDALTLKSSIPVYTVCHFINSNVVRFYDQKP